ncbi:hypothetical protein NC653_023755 [Populus alba x Populus x berolinensis]|uniref:non-specific serine/threonine protein kinase n=1 Tax=Populus alba x Populus x berolinensis TaxID=444605 RepID=A0AAD6MI05_9ROSI|nr:hypothetical protein NC653_023755 [Populus alba x Populus x berolinensis]
MEPPPWLEDLTDDLQSISFTSTATTTTTLHRSTSSGSSSATLTPAPSTHTSFSSKSTSKHSLSLSDLRFSHRLGSGDIGSVYLAELKTKLNEMGLYVFCGEKIKKEERGRSGKYLKTLDHPFLPALYAFIDTQRWLCLLTEFCPGGDLHVLRQRQPLKRFEETAVSRSRRKESESDGSGTWDHILGEGTVPSAFYASEVIVALEYLHMMGIVYRDLKPENVLVRSDGHIMLTDFDLSLKCDDSTLSPTKKMLPQPPKMTTCFEHPSYTSSSCILPNCIVPAVSCFHPRRKRKKKMGNRGGPEFVAEPVDVRSMSFVGTHEYLAPEIVSGEGHGSPVDWWTLGIFMFELFYGFTPFRGVDHELTLANVVARALEFPKEPAVPAAAKDLISQLLVKDPARRMGSPMGASAVKHHPFFQGVNWALLRCRPPPYVPPPFSREVVSDESCPETPVEYY